MGKQFELNLKRKPDVPIDYQFSQDYLKGVVRKEIARITGNPDLLAGDLNIPDVKKEIKYVLSMRGLQADFQEDKIVIRVGKKDTKGEYYEGYAKRRQVG